MAELGGLGQATGIDPDELEDPSIVPVTGALEDVATTGTGERKKAKLPTQSKRSERMTTGAAMERLNEARTRLTSRLEEAKGDRTGEWLAFAQGMLSPTETGGFGESLGKAAGAVGVARSARRQQLTDIESDLLDAEVKQQTLALQARPRLGGSETVYHPDDVAEFPLDKSKWRHIEKQTIVHSDGFSEHIFTGTEDGEILQVVSKSNPITVGEAKKAEVISGERARLDSHDINQGLVATLASGRLRKARDLFEIAKTSGLKSDIAGIGTYLGIDIADNATLPVIRNLIGKEVLTQLQALTGTKTDFEYKKIESLNASTEQNPEANLRIIDEMIGRYDRIINIGERAALAHAEDPDTDLQVQRYREYRSGEEERKAMAAQAGVEERKIAPPAAVDRLIQLFDPNNPTNPQLIEFYKTRYGWPPTDPEVLSKLREKGFKD